jgi:U6 snRNA-associated Sm-like protein LSm7
MAERGQHSSGRGGRGGNRGDHRGGRGGGPGRGGSAQQGQERPKKENILDLGKYMDKRITVKFNGGREGALILYPKMGIEAIICPRRGSGVEF